MINYPDRISEIEVQFDLVNKLKKKYQKKGYQIRMNVLGKIGLKKNYFDIVIFLNKKPYLIIEVKKSQSGVNPKQMKEYLSYNVPLIYCNNKSNIPSVLKSIEYHFNKLYTSKIITSIQ